MLLPNTKYIDYFENCNKKISPVMTEIKKVTTFNHKTKKNATENRCFVSEQ